MADKTITDRKEAVMPGGLSSVHTAHEDTDGETADDVYSSYDETSDGITFDELAGTVHSTVKVGFTLNVLTALLCALFINQPRVQISINGHLFTGHSIEGETGGDFSDSFSTFSDDEHLNDDEYQEHDDTDYIITADNEVPESVNQLTGIAIKENEPSSRDVEGQSEQRRDEQ